jgi:hypothetical protein
MNKKNLPFGFFKNSSLFRTITHGTFEDFLNDFLRIGLVFRSYCLVPHLVAEEFFCRSGQICLKYCNTATDATQSDTTHYVH